MIRQKIRLEQYGWTAYVYYAVDCYYIEEIIGRLVIMGCNEDMIEDAYRSIKECNLDTGLTYSNGNMRTSIVVISLTSSPEEFQNTFDHEKGHLCKHIVQTLGIDPFGEEAEYLAGEVGQQMFPIAKKFLCEHCRTKLYRQTHIQSVYS